MSSHSPRVVVVTGSIGKSSTKHAISRVLSRSFNVNQNPGDANGGDELRVSFFGICLRELKYPPGIWGMFYWLYIGLLIKWRSHWYPYDILVLELSETEFVKDLQELDRFLMILNPELCIITGLSGAHMSRMGSRKSIVKALVHIASSAKAVIYNSDHKKLVPFSNLPNFYGSYSMNDGSYSNPNLHGGVRASIAAAQKVAEYFDISLNELKPILSALKPLTGRMNTMIAMNGAVVIDDTFNASTEAVINGLEHVRTFNDLYKVAVLGGINELGEYEEDEHKKIAKIANEIADLTIFIGKQFKEIASSNNLNSSVWFNNSLEAGLYIKDNCQSNWVLYAKGSQDKIFVEEAIKPVLSWKNRKRLPRQSRYWMKIKRAYFKS